MNSESEQRIEVLSGADTRQKREVMERSGTNLLRCLQCGSCSNGCPYVQAMDVPPNRLMRLLQYGYVEEALACGTIWVCVGCDTCASQCPMAIDIPAVMDALRQMNLESGLPAALPEVLELHEEILKSIFRYGRTHKLEIMLRYKVRKKAWFEDMDVGLKMLSKRKLHLLPSKIKNIGQVQDLFREEVS